MSEQESVWYYTQHGERKGPVTLEVLRGAIEHMKIDREKDLIWGPGLSDWVVMDKVPELQGVAAGPPPVVPTEPPPAPAVPSVSTPSAPANGIGSSAKTEGDSANPYESPASLEDDTALADAMNARREGETSPGMGRLMFWFAPTAICLIVVFTTIFVGGMLSGEDPNSIGIYAIIGNLIATVICLFAVFSRLKNLGMSRWCVLWSIVPIMSFWLLYRLYICPAGYNEHKKLDGAGKVLVGVYAVAFIGYFGLVFTVGSSYYKEAVDKAQQQIQQQQRAEETATE